MLLDGVKLYSDGGSRGNPGPAAIGIHITDEKDHRLLLEAECIGRATNNQAEYRALIWGLRTCTRFTRGRVACHCDNEVVVNQMNGVYKVKNPELKKLHEVVLEQARCFEVVIYDRLPREDHRIAAADRALNKALSRGGSRAAFGIP